MAVSMEDGRVRGGDRDPLVQDTTPGCVWRFQPRFVARTSNVVRAVQSSQPDRRSEQRIPPVWIVGPENGYVASFQLGRAANVHLNLSTNTADPLNGVNPGPQVVPAAVSGWGLVLFDGQGNAAYATLADMAAADTTPGEPWGQHGNIGATAFQSIMGTTSLTGWTAVIVDRAHPNVDWANLEFVAVREGAGFNLGNDLMLRGLTAGPLYLVLHGGSPPTAANRLTGGGYQDVAITGPAGWELSAIAGERVIQNSVRLEFGTATNVWTRATHVALWTGAAATGDLLWYDVIDEFTTLVGGEPHVPIRGGRIAAPNLV